MQGSSYGAQKGKGDWERCNWGEAGWGRRLVRRTLLGLATGPSHSLGMTKLEAKPCHPEAKRRDPWGSNCGADSLDKTVPKRQIFSNNLNNVSTPNPDPPRRKYSCPFATNAGPAISK